MYGFKSHFPRIGMRIIKSALAVAFCLLIYFIAGRDGIPFFLVIAALQGLQPYQKDVGYIAERNVIGTIVGALCSLGVLLIHRFLLLPLDASQLWFYVFVTIGVGLSLYGAVVLGYGEASYFSAVVFLCIIMVDMDQRSPFFYVLQRFFETIIGIGIGIVINNTHIPRRRVTDTLFVAALDDVLHSESSILPEYSKVELNRLLDEGVRLSVITQHSSASFWQAAGSIQFKMPIILLDGAVMYNPDEKRYLAKVELSYGETMRLMNILEDEELTLMQSAIIDNTVLIFHQYTSELCRPIYEELRKTPYRNYLNMPLPEGLDPVYVFCMGSDEKLDEAIEKLKDAGVYEQYKIMRYSFQNHEGMGYMRIFSREADRQKMLELLRKTCGLEKLRTFGNDPELYDVCVRSAEGESIIKYLHQQSEPYFWQKMK